jgi:hypothetical protein
MALIDLKSDLSKFRSDFQTPPLADKPYTAKLPTKNSRFDQGIVSIDNQLGSGSPFPDFVDSNGIKIYDWKPTKHTGFTDKKTYSLSAGKKGFLEATYTTNSPIDDVYKKYNLRDEAFNFQYIRHPLILRGLQRKGNEKPNRWGVDALTNFDDGLARGGITTVIDRTIADTARIAKWIASPKGILWVVRQIGLGLSNPNVEKSAGSTLLGIQQTKVHTGLASLLSVPGSPLGLHITRHGIPFKNELASYEQVIKTNQLASTGEPYSRLITVKKELFGRTKTSNTNQFYNNIQNSLRTVNGWTGAPILALSTPNAGIGGPGSVYGIGGTIISRYVNTAADALERAKNYGFNLEYNVYSQYGAALGASHLYNSTTSDDLREQNFYSDDGGKVKTLLENASFEPSSEKTALEKAKKYNFTPIYKIARQYASAEANVLNKSDDKKNNTKSKVDVENSKNNSEQDSLRTKTEKLKEETPGSGTNSKGLKGNLATSEARKKAFTEVKSTGINSYLTLAYNKIPKDVDKKKFSDFRTNIDTKGIDEKSAKGILGTGTNKDYYKDNNLEDNYGFGKLGALNTDPNVDRRTPTGKGSFLVEGLDFSRKKNRKALIETANFRGDKVTALDISSGTTRLTTENVYPDKASDLIKFFFEDGDQGYNVMPFRCTITGLSDSFSPGWDRIDIMGRPDGAYLYSSFERSISFSFIAAALSRSEMIPMWRKLNYLASYTMPDFNAAGAKPSGPFMRITIGDMFQRTPGFIESLSYTIPDDATWDIADDYDSGTNPDPKQLPMVVEASVTFKVIADYRPQMMGRVYSLSPNGSKKAIKGQWLSDAETA